MHRLPRPTHVMEPMTPPRKYFTQLLAARFLGISVAELDKLTYAGLIKTYNIDRYDPKLCVEDLEKILRDGGVKALMSRADAAPTESPQPAYSPPRWDPEPELPLPEITSTSFSHVPPQLVPYTHAVALYALRPDGEFEQCRSRDGAQLGRILTAKPLQECYVQNSERQVLVDTALSDSTAVKPGNFVSARARIETLYAAAIFAPRAPVISALSSVAEAAVTASMFETTVTVAECTRGWSSYPAVSHVSNVFALAIRFCAKNHYSVDQAVNISLGALLHDIGMAVLPPPNAHEENSLRGAEERSRLHVSLGQSLVRLCHIEREGVEQAVTEHHERLDGSGYPNATRRTSFYGQLIALLDTFDRKLHDPAKPHSNQSPFEALASMKEEVKGGKLNPDLFRQLVGAMSQ